MRRNAVRGERPCKQTKWSRTKLYLTESLVRRVRRVPEGSVGRLPLAEKGVRGNGGSPFLAAFEPLALLSTVEILLR